MLLSYFPKPYHRRWTARQILLALTLMHCLTFGSLSVSSVFPARLYGQDAASNNQNNTNNADTDAEREQRLRDLRLRSQQSDVATASYFELQELARELGISPNKNIAVLRASIYHELGISAPNQGSTNQNDLVIRIESAQKAKAFTIERQEEDSEDYFKIIGGVRVYISDQKEGYEHTVSADTITFNRKQNTIRAEGEVTYIKKKLKSKDDKDTEKFTGDSLVFRLRVWRGVIFYGIFSRNQKTETERPIDAHANSSNPEKTKSDPNANTNSDNESILGKTVLAQNNITYYFDGEKMRKGSDDILVLEKGAISTSDDEQTEYFRLGFHRLWIFGKPEWAMLSATLYVGHIPVLYLPYYYHNDSQLLFHPVFGIREAYGELLQTTTYLFGQPETASTDSLSFLPVNTGTESDRKLKLDAMYLVPSNEKEDKKKEKKLGADSYLKLLFDYYSYIGLFTGFEGVFKNLGPITSLDVNATLAYAYALEERSGAGYATGKPYILNSDGTYSLQPIDSNFFGLTIPFRYGIDTSLRSKNNIISLDFKHYSDPFYRRDYFNRKENFDWISYGLERAQRDSDNLLEEWRKKESTISSYKWELALNLRPRFRTSLLSSFDFRAYLATYFDKKSDIEREAYDPTREFFYPKKFFLPDTSLRISGTLWPLSESKNTARQKKENFPLFEDWKYQPKDDDEAEQPDSEEELGEEPQKTAENAAIGKPDELVKIKKEKQGQVLSFRTTYNLGLQNLLQTQTDYSLWNRVEDIELNNEELQFTGKESVQLVTEWKLLDIFLNIKLKHNVDVNVSHYFDIIENTNNSNDLTATKQANKWNWTEESTITLKPLYLLDWFANSSISHNIKASIYDYQYDTTQEEHQGSFLDLNQSDEDLRKRITAHRLTTFLDFHPFKDAYNPINNLEVSFSMTNEIAPRIPKNTLKPRLFFEIFHWSHDVSIEIEQESEDDPNFYAQPLNYTSIYKPLEKLEFKNVFVYNFEAESEKEPHVEKEEISFKAWWFSGGLYFRYTQPYEWDKIALTWKTKGNPDLIPDKVNLGFELTTKDHYLWKNRILFYFTFKSKWDQDLIRYNQTSSLTVEFSFSFFIYEFLNLQISYRMSNEKLYLYYPGMKDFFGISQNRYILEDLWNSVSFWDVEKQKKGLFKMKDIRFLAIHHLKDWDLIFEFVGKPKLVSNNLTWDYALGFYLRWIPIPLLKRRAIYQDNTILTDAR